MDKVGQSTYNSTPRFTCGLISPKCGQKEGKHFIYLNGKKLRLEPKTSFLFSFLTGKL